MSFEITTAFVQQFGNNAFHLAQQKGSKLRNAVRLESLKGKQGFIDRIGAVAAQVASGRHQDTVYSDTPHSRRRVTMVDYRWADLIDDEDKLRMLIDPASDYVQAAMWSLGRSMDDVIIAAMRGSAWSGETGSTEVALPASRKVLSAEDGAPGTPKNLNLDTLRNVKHKFDSADIDEAIPRFFAISSSQLRSLLAETEITSQDYASVKALVQGQIDTFMGFKFIRTERLPLVAASYDTDGTVDSGGGSISASYARRCLAWAQDGVVLALGRDMEAMVDRLPTKNYATQAFARMSIGSTRIEENKVVEVVCTEDPAA